jgi:hypothetical protein
MAPAEIGIADLVQRRLADDSTPHRRERRKSGALATLSYGTLDQTSSPENEGGSFMRRDARVESKQRRGSHPQGRAGCPSAPNARRLHSNQIERASDRPILKETMMPVRIVPQMNVCRARTIRPRLRYSAHRVLAKPHC